MRLMVHLVILLMVSAMGATVAFSRYQRHAKASLHEDAQGELARFQARIHLESAKLAVTRAEQTYPITIDPEWFEGELPRNLLLGSGRPWVEIAPRSQWGLRHPPNLTALSRNDAAFWYNPASGTLRARVPQSVSDDRTRDLYKQINGMPTSTPVLAIAESSAND